MRLTALAKASFTVLAPVRPRTGAQLSALSGCPVKPATSLMLYPSASVWAASVFRLLMLIPVASFQAAVAVCGPTVKITRPLPQALSWFGRIFAASPEVSTFAPRPMFTALAA
jgi:hypothetical protein